MIRRRGRFRRWPCSEDFSRYLVSPHFAVHYVIAWSLFLWWWHS